MNYEYGENPPPEVFTPRELINRVRLPRIKIMKLIALYKFVLNWGQCLLRRCSEQ